MISSRRTWLLRAAAGTGGWLVLAGAAAASLGPPPLRLQSRCAASSHAGSRCSDGSGDPRRSALVALPSRRRRLDSSCRHGLRLLQQARRGVERAVRGQRDRRHQSRVVRKTVKRKKARCECCRTIVTAPAPSKLFPGARYSIAFAVLVVGKGCRGAGIGRCTDAAGDASVPWRAVGRAPTTSNV